MARSEMLVLSLGADTAASSRVRAATVQEVASSRGWKVRRVCANSRSWPVRMLTILVSSRPDVMYIQKVLAPSVFVGLAKFFSSRLVFEIDDAVYLGYPGDSPAAAERARRRVDAAIRRADAVTTTSHAIATDLQSMTGVRATVFPGPAPDCGADVTHAAKRSVLWLGSPSTYHCVSPFIEMSLEGRLPGQLVIVGAPRSGSQLPHTCEHVWSRDVEARELQRARVGIVNVLHDTWSSRKVYYKLLVYLAAGVVPVCSGRHLLERTYGAEVADLCVFSHDEEADSWAEAIAAAWAKMIDRSWTEQRDRLFERLSMERFADLVLGGSHGV